MLLCFFGSRGKKNNAILPNTDYRDKGRGHDRRLGFSLPCACLTSLKRINYELQKKLWVIVCSFEFEHLTSEPLFLSRCPRHKSECQWFNEQILMYKEIFKSDFNNCKDNLCICSAFNFVSELKFQTSVYKWRNYLFTSILRRRNFCFSLKRNSLRVNFVVVVVLAFASK